MGNRITAIDEQQLHEWVNIIAKKAGTACDSKISSVVTDLLKMLKALQADKKILTTVAAQQGELLRVKNLDISPLIQKLELPQLQEDARPVLDISYLTWFVISLLLCLVIIQSVVIWVGLRPCKMRCMTRPASSKPVLNQSLSTVSLKLDRTKSASLKSILPL